MQIEFDPEKDRANQAKHGVSLAFAEEVLADPRRLDVADVRFDYGEDRWLAYGRVGTRVWACVYTIRKMIHRIISLRKANDRETKDYYETAR